VIRQAATKLLSKLDQSHFGLIPAEFYEKNGDEASESGWTGIEFRLLAGAPIITAVEPNSPASLAGLSPGGEIVAIGEQSIEEVTDLSAAGEIPADVIEQAVYEKIASKLSGELGETVKLTLKAVDGGEKTVEMTAVAVPGKVTQFGNLPPMTVQLETKMLDDAVGYIRFNLFMDPARLLEQIGEFVSNNQDAKGMIIDLRGNLGGLGAMAMGLAGWFAIEEQQSLGQMQTRQGNLNFVYFRRPKSFRGPLAILVDERSMSTAEIFPGGLQAHGRCRIFGRPTPGMALPSIVEILPNGDRFLHAFANFVLPEGEALEGVGVTPDELVVLDRQQLSAGIDQDVQAAKRWLLQAADAE
jgi:carboxyl-terminal processing protease